MTVGKVYDCHDYLPEQGIVFLTGDRGYEVIGKVSNEKDAHGVKLGAGEEMTGAKFELISSLVIVAFIIIAVAVSKSGYEE